MSVTFADGGAAALGHSAVMATVAKRIIVGFDGSDSARRALDRAADLAGYGSTVTVVSVAGRESQGEDWCVSGREQLEARLVPAYGLSPVGDPAQELVKAATTLGADLLVIGTRPSGHAQGAVAAELLERAPCDVLVVR